MKLIVTAASTVYPFIIEENLTRDHVKTIYNKGLVKPGTFISSTMGTMFEDLKSTVPIDEDYNKLYSAMNRQAQLDAYERGERDYARVCASLETTASSTGWRRAMY